jgi:hypothetical protein
MDVNEVVDGIDKKIVSNENLNQFRQGFAGGLGASRPRIPRLGRSNSTKNSTNSTVSESATAAHNGNTQAARSGSTQESVAATTGQSSEGGTVISHGGDQLASFKSKVQNAFKGIDKTHLDAAIGDMAGNPIIKHGKVWDHLSDITNHLKNLNGRIKELNNLINKNTFAGETLEEAKALRSSLQKQYDSYSGALQRAANKYQKRINVKKSN